MIRLRPKLFRGRHFQDEIIILCVRWYLRYSLSYRDLEEMMAERGVEVDHSTIDKKISAFARVFPSMVSFCSASVSMILASSNAPAHQ